MKIHELIVEAPAIYQSPAQLKANPLRQKRTVVPPGTPPAVTKKALPVTPPAPVAKAAPVAKPLPTTPAAPPAAKVAAPAPAAKEPIVQATDDMEQRMLDRMGKRFGLPPGSSADEVQAAQQAYLDKNDPAAAAQYKKNMANIDAGGAQADNQPVKLADKPAAAKPEQSADWQAGLAAHKAGASPIGMMVAQPSIAKNQKQLDAIASTLKLPAGSSVKDILAADAKAADTPAGPSIEQQAIDSVAAGQGLPAGMTQDELMAAYAKKLKDMRSGAVPESVGGAVDSRGRTQAQWMKLVKQKFPTARIQQAKMIDGPAMAILDDGRKLNWSKADQNVEEGPASRKLCTSGKPDSALGASNLASCKSQGYRSRDGGKSHKVGRERVKVQGKKIKGKKYGGPLPDWS
jgi:hypothetical protein